MIKIPVMNSPVCSICGRPLTDPHSVAVGMDPDCRARLIKRGWKFPKPKYRVRSGKVEYLGMTGKVVRPFQRFDGLELIDEHPSSS